MASVGLLLGAGASYEMGMPLVTELTAELKNWLTPEKLRGFNEQWRQRGGGHAPEALDTLARGLSDPEMHYESILGSLELGYVRHSPHQQDFAGLYSWLSQMVYYLLYARHVQNEVYIERGLRYFEGIAGLAHANDPLWVFSLNHDLIIECLCAQYQIALHAGFDGEVTLPRRDAAGLEIGRLGFETLKGSDLAAGLRLAQPGRGGINLLKVHGSLDIFTTNDGHDLVKLRPLGEGVAGYINALRAANEDLFYSEPQWPDQKVHATNEIAYADDDGVMQFLRRSVLAGAFKFDPRTSQVLPNEFLGQFQSHLNYVSDLTVIGYGFGDQHINDAIRRWLEFSEHRRMHIVAPGVQRPPSFAHLTGQVTIVDAKASDHLEQFALTPLTLPERAMKVLRQEMRDRKRKELEGA